ncbi:microfibrillar-associated protein 5 isoform X1 [Petaurus breviceps papuanus]|uniref:microfibrillar-associated protein 5 isoform X1 n=1 Tax=Petaurus breviceps papuanus TaxID=3040969 RepID=UPI0036DEBEFE
MLPLGPKLLLCLIALFIPSDWSLLGVNGQRGDETTQETFTDDPNLMVNDPPTDDTVLVDVVPSTDDQAVSSDKNTTAECREEQFPCTRLYSVHRPVKQCIHQLCIVNLRRMYIINKEICSRLICKEHEVMKGKMRTEGWRRGIKVFWALVCSKHRLFVKSQDDRFLLQNTAKGNCTNSYVRCPFFPRNSYDTKKGPRILWIIFSLMIQWPFRKLICIVPPTLLK